jgi:Outer membrane protein beta-barrel domain
MFRLPVLILLVYTLYSGKSLAQSPLRFGTGVFAGLNLSQVDGDDMQGYDKPGINFGLRGITYILPTFEFHTELSYSQRGSQSKGYNRDLFKGRKMILDYGAITGLLSVNDWLDPIKEFYRVQIQGGVSYGRLIRSETLDVVQNDARIIPFNEIAPYFNNSDLSMVLGANIKFTEHMGITFRYNRSMSLLFDSEAAKQHFMTRSPLSMKGYFLSIDTFYHF